MQLQLSWTQEVNREYKGRSPHFLFDKFVYTSPYKTI